MHAPERCATPRDGQALGPHIGCTDRKCFAATPVAVSVPIDSSWLARDLQSGGVLARSGALMALPEELAALDVRRPLLLTSVRISRAPLQYHLFSLIASLDPAICGAVPPRASLSFVRGVARLALERKVDGIVAAGGGSVSDTAKALAIALAEGEPLEQHAIRYESGTGFVTPVLSKPKLPIISIPTTAYGAEVTPTFSLRSPDDSLLSFFDPKVISRRVLIDPVAAMGFPVDVQLTTGMNGLAYCLEALYSRRRTAATSLHALNTIERFAWVLPALHAAPDDPFLRSESVLAGYCAGQVHSVTGGCIHHALCNVLTSRHGLANGPTNSVMLPHVLKFNAAIAHVELDAVCERLGLQGAGTPGERVIGFIKDLQSQIKARCRLSELTDRRDILADAPTHVMREWSIANNPRPVSHIHEVERLLGDAW